MRKEDGKMQAGLLYKTATMIPITEIYTQPQLKLCKICI